MKLSELAERIDGKLEGSGEEEVRGVAGIHEATADEISFIANPRYIPQATTTKALAVIVSDDFDQPCPAVLVRVKNPDAAFAKAAALFYTPPPLPEPGAHPTAVIAGDVKLGKEVRIGAQCVIEAGVQIGDGTVIFPQCYVGYRSRIGQNSRLYPQVSLRESVTVGDRTIIHNGTVIGSDGFGYSVNSQGVRTKIPQIGTVIIGDDVEIGANVTVDRARFGRTVIGNGVKIDNLVQIAHNVEIGDHAVIIAQVGISGSTTIGSRAILAGQAGLAGHLKIGAGAIVGPRSAVTKDIPDGVYVMGEPAMPVAKMKRSHASLMLLPRLKERVVELEQKVKELERVLSGAAEKIK